MKKIIFNFLIFIACLLALSLWGFYWAIRPMRILSSVTPKDFGLAFENVEFRTADNVLIRGWFIPNPNTSKTIILLHGYPADKGDILPSRLFLHKDYNLLFFDFRYFGNSEGTYSTIGKKEIQDVAAALDFLHKRNLHDVGIWGFSLGGAVALMSAAQFPEIKAVVAESSYANLDNMATNYFSIPLLNYPLGKLLGVWAKIFLNININKVSPVDSAKQLTIPVLIMHSKQDNVVPFNQAELLQKTLANKRNIQFLFFDDLRHGQTPTNYSTVKNFFDKSL